MRLNREYLMLGLSLHEHPLARYRMWLDREGILNSKAVNRCPVGRVVRVAGLNVVHQAPPTAKGHHFVTLEDEEGYINVVLRPKVYARFRQVVRQAPFLIVEGIVQRAGSVTNLLASNVDAIS